MCDLACLCYCVVVILIISLLVFFFFKQKTAYEMRISDWSSDVCSSDLICLRRDSLLGAALDRCEQPVERSNVVIPLDHLILSLEDIEICLQGALTQR